VLLSRTVSRFFLVFGVLALAAAWRLDQAVAVGYRTDWVAPRFLQRQQASPFGCQDCWRLPNKAWLWVSALTGAAALLSLLVATILFHLRHWKQNDPQEPNTPQGVRDLTVFFGSFAAVLALATAIARYLAASGHGNAFVQADTGLALAALACLALIVVAVAASLPSTISGPYTLVQRIARFLYRQRVNALGLAFLTTALLFLAQTSGQAIDSMRTWGLDSAHSIARLGFGVGSTLLLSLVIYESAVQLTQVRARNPRARRLPSWVRVVASRLRAVAPSWVWVVAFGCGLIALGIILVAVGPFAYGPIVIGSLVVLLGLLDIPKFEEAPPSPQAVPQLDASEKTAAEPEATEEETAEESVAEAQKRYDERVAEILAAVPLLLYAVTGVAAAIDAALSGGKRNALGPLVPTIILAGAAILMTAERQPRRFDVPGWRAWAGAVAIVGLASVVLVGFESEVGAAILAFLGCGVALLYSLWLFHIAPPKDEGATDSCCSALSLPMAIAVGLGTLIAVHWDPFGSTTTLGTLTLVSFALALWLAVLNFFIFSSFHLRPPRALAYIGMRQLPILALVAIAWIGAGWIGSPPTIHEARLVDRDAIAARPAPTLSDAFKAWVRAQPELSAKARNTQGMPIPMFLVAAHGGGIRAAYWTGLVLDCVVGVSSSGFDLGRLQAGDEPTRQATCHSQRRSPAEQERAERRIFVASGVSGGAVGLYAYARQLLSPGSLGDGSWVGTRLGRDFASPMIGWGLFHDVTNHWLGLNSHRGGDCAWKIGSTCMTADRAAIQEDAFDRAWSEGRFAPLLRLSWDMRSSTNQSLRDVAQTIPLLITNATVTGGKERALVSAANLGTWPNLDAFDPGRGNFDAYPLAGTVEVVDTACAAKDIRLSTAALLGSRFPYVAPSGHLSGRCGQAKGPVPDSDSASACAMLDESICEMRLVDGGYADNSGLFTIDALWPSLRQLVMNFNRQSKRQIAPVILEVDNHYRARLDTELAAGGASAESLVPLLTAFGARNSIETFARALAYRLRPPGCAVTISPGLHPGLTAPLGWELSEGARDDLSDGLIRPHPTEVGTSRYRPVLDLRRLQQWFGAGNEPSAGLSPLKACIPKASATG
jgi:hypothetical protein